MKNCIICNEIITINATRCLSCAAKERLKSRNLAGRNNPMFGIKGKKHPSFTNGLTHNNRCINCKKHINHGYVHCKSCAKMGKLNNNWNNGVSFLPYTSDFTVQLKDSIRKRDDYICQNCGMTEKEHLIVVGRVLTIHHIDYNKMNCDEDNLITTCMGCNTRANTDRDYWYAYFSYIMENYIENYA